MDLWSPPLPKSVISAKLSVKSVQPAISVKPVISVLRIENGVLLLVKFPADFTQSWVSLRWLPRLGFGFRFSLNFAYRLFTPSILAVWDQPSGNHLLYTGTIHMQGDRSIQRGRIRTPWLYWASFRTPWLYWASFWILSFVQWLALAATLNQLNTCIEKSRGSSSLGSPCRTKTCQHKVRVLGGCNLSKRF